MPVSAPQRPTAGPTPRQPFLTATTTPDAILVGRAAQGDERAFELLFRRHRTDVLAYATRMLRDHGRAEDVVQDVFVSAMRAIVGAPVAEQPVHVRAWLREIARRACIDQWRGVTRRGEVSLDAPERLRDGDALRLADDDSLVRATDDREAIATLRRAFDDLPELQTAVLVQRELEGRSIAEIASRLELTPTVVEGQLARGRRALGQAYRELQSGERCVAVRALCDASVGGRLGVRDRHRIGRHVQRCDGCRRYARTSGVDPRLVDRTLLARASFLLPLPLLRRLPVDQVVVGDAAGGVIGAKVLVGAAMIAAGSGGVYISNVAPPRSADADKPAATSAPTGSPFGLRPGGGGTAVLRVPVVGGLAPAVVLPAGDPGHGVRAVSPSLAGDDDREDGSAAGVPADAEPPAVAPSAPVDPEPPAVASPDAGALPSPPVRSPAPSGDTPLAPSTGTPPPSGSEPEGESSAPRPAAPAAGDAPAVSSDDTSASAEAPAGSSGPPAVSSDDVATPPPAGGAEAPEPAPPADSAPATPAVVPAPEPEPAAPEPPAAEPEPVAVAEVLAVAEVPAGAAPGDV